MGYRFVYHKHNLHVTFDRPPPPPPAERSGPGTSALLLITQSFGMAGSRLWSFLGRPRGKQRDQLGRWDLPPPPITENQLKM